MGFFGALGKVLSGKPVYTAANVEADSGKQPAAQQQQAQAPRRAPSLLLTRVESHLDANHMDVYVDLVNHSNENVFIDDITLLGTKREVQRQLRPGEEHQQPVYSGPTLADQPDGYAELRFRREDDGKYFISRFQVHCWRQSNGQYVVDEFRLTGPTREV